MQKTVKLNKICLDIDRGMIAEALQQYKEIGSESDTEVKICTEIIKHRIRHEELKKSGDVALIKKVFFH